MAAKREIKTPGVTAEQNQDQQQAQTPETNQDTSTKDQADAALEHITGDDQNTGETGPSQEELLRQELAEMRAQMAELKKSTQPEAPSAAGAAQPKKRIPVLTEKGWSTKEAD
ncbi:hypothetical protein KWF57_18555 [Acinetobacter baumannii]|uniref:hypothetical protein n=1 Tax=Acinetobacter baumannii TaxID=470 RepID=UPI00097D8003|nr:hypothetical protein [Acinetobacter baumannii]MPU13719.1 hypothetical protein [Acinetobacter baumannii]PQL70118.1 hypothetical protein CV956_006025 [Acinetobacter baumannii]PQL88180.1 hypothetical protein CV955_0006785 [Acinetobacter baumannii]HAV5289355.1 hypothetical protein [Acinetobacter baumannii]HAV5304349.1 hypothetical protein [Acinetobacter baumannii]